MTVRAVEGKKPYTGGTAIEITEDKKINLLLREANNLLQLTGNNELFCDLQLDDEIRPTDVFPVGVTTGRIIEDNGWDWTGTILCAKTTSGDNIKLVYTDGGEIYVDNGTGTFTQLYTKTEVDDLLAYKQDKLIAGNNIHIDSDGKTISAVVPTMTRFLSLWDCSTGLADSTPSTLPYEYTTGDYFIVSVVDNTTNYRPEGTEYTGVASTTIETDNVDEGYVYLYDGSRWLLQVSTGVDFSAITGDPYDNINLSNALNAKANTSDVLAKNNTTSYTPSADYNPATKKYVDDKTTFSPFPNTFNTSGTTAQFLTSIENLNLPVGSAYLGQVSLSDMPTGVSVQGDVEVYIYPQNVIYAVMRSVEVPPYIWVVDSYSNSYNNRGWTAESNLYTGSSAPTSSAVEGMLWYDTVNDELKVYDGTQWNSIGGGGGAAAWGQITGTLSDQTDLQNALDAKQDLLQAGNGISITSANRTRSNPTPTLSISVDTQVVATQTEVANKQDGLTESTNIDIFDDPVYERVLCQDTMGPCPAGFHIPLKSEADSLRSKGITLHAWTSNDTVSFATYMKIPKAGYLYSTGTAFYDKDSSSRMRCANQYSSSSGYFWGSSNFDSTSNQYINKCCGLTIRPFKDTPVEPDSTWVTLFDGSSTEQGAGIFWSQELGLISIRATLEYGWITIADKNLGATEVFNRGDTLTEANCGHYYQRGNNHPFSWTTLPTNISTTRVDASVYGPGNYYNSSTFINQSFNSWDDPVNSNLRGGVSQGTTYEEVPTGETILKIKSVPMISSSAPIGVSQGAYWYDTTNAVLKIYDGTAWQTAGEVKSVNGSTGVVVINDTKISSTAPSNPTEGMLWYDTTNDVLKSYDGTNWNAIGGSSYTAGTGIDITSNTISVDSNTVAMQSDISVVSGDAGVTYIIKKSSTPPAAGTPSNVLTFVG